MRLVILHIMFTIIAFFIIILFARLNVTVDVLLTFRKRMHGRAISLWGEVWARKTSVTTSLFFHWSVCIEPGKWAVMYLCRGNRLCLFLRFFLLHFGTVRTVWQLVWFTCYFSCFIKSIIQSIVVFKFQVFKFQVS